MEAVKKMAVKTFLTVGVFDLLHYGHYELLRRVRELAGKNGRVVVAVQEDAIVAKYKPHAHLVYDWNTRAKMIHALRYVDEVVPYSDVDVSIKDIEFDTFVVGCDQNHAGFQRALAWCSEKGKQVVTLPRTDGISTTKLKEIGFYNCNTA